MPHSRAEAIQMGIPLAPIKHRKTRRAFWHLYYKRGYYGVTIHLSDEMTNYWDDRHLLSKVVGDVNEPPRQDACRLGPQPDGSWCLEVTNPNYPHIVLTDVGRLIESSIMTIGRHRNEQKVKLISYVIMPTHIHLTLAFIEDLPFHTVRGKSVRITLSDVIRSLEQGTTSKYRRWLAGEPIDQILSQPDSWRERQALAAGTTTPSSPSSPFNVEGASIEGASSSSRNAPNHLWNSQGFNDSLLITRRRYFHWLLYVIQNPFHWRMRDQYPHLYEHRLHIRLAGMDFSSYGGQFLLQREHRVQVFCHRAARKGMLTAAECQKISDNLTSGRMTAQAYEQRARELKLGRYSYDWVPSTSPDAIVPIPYIETQAFEEEKARCLKACEEGAILISPAISPGEQAIFYAALAEGYDCIKLQDRPLQQNEHPTERDRQYCASGQLLVLGPWECTQPTRYATFHNLNNLAKMLCEDVHDYAIDPQSLMECR